MIIFSVFTIQQIVYVNMSDITVTINAWNSGEVTAIIRMSSINPTHADVELI